MAGWEIPLRRIRNGIAREHNEFIASIDRARRLFLRLTQNYPWNADRRDIAQFLFFEVASQWEAFCVATFELELKQLYSVRRSVATLIMSDVDGRSQISGFGHPEMIRDRAKALLRKRSPWANIEQDLGAQAYRNLWHGYRTRNFIAHAGIGKGREDFHKLLNELNIPTPERKGLSAGRFLLEYSQNGINWFNILLDNYREVADYVLSKAW